VLVRAVRGLEISFCKIDSLRSFGERRAFPPRVTMAIAINTLGDIPAPANPGNPEEVSGHLLITRNDIDAAGEIAQDATTGVIVFSVGQLPDRAVDLDVIGNVIRNATAGTINLRRVEGRTRVVSNTLSTSAEAAMGTDAVRLANVGSYLIASNKIESRQVDGIGIAVFSQFPQWPIERAVVEDNDVLMSPRPGGAFGDSSAGIAVRGFAHGNIVRHNTIRGRARAALATYVFKGGVPADNEFIDNRFENFHATVADIFVGSGVVKRRIVGPGTLMDQGAGPTIQR
jgi:hypothetical protein